jgi:hypothetical protein
VAKFFALATSAALWFESNIPKNQEMCENFQEVFNTNFPVNINLKKILGEFTGAL